MSSMVRDLRPSLEIECSFFNRGKGVCPFGSNCFYKHTNETSGEHKPNIAINASGELVDLNNNVRTPPPLYP